jgi:hypothetical protein
VRAPDKNCSGLLSSEGATHTRDQLHYLLRAVKRDPPDCGEGANENKFPRMHCLHAKPFLSVNNRRASSRQFLNESFISLCPFSLVYILTSYSGSVGLEKNDDAVYFSCLHTK